MNAKQSRLVKDLRSIISERPFSLAEIDEKRMALLIEKISGIRTVRNLFIHGLWDSPAKQENDLIIRCPEPKLVYEATDKGRKWNSARNHRFRLSNIKRLVEQIDIITLEQQFMFNNLEEEEFF